MDQQRKDALAAKIGTCLLERNKCVAQAEELRIKGDHLGYRAFTTMAWSWQDEMDKCTKELTGKE